MKCAPCGPWLIQYIKTHLHGVKTHRDSQLNDFTEQVGTCPHTIINAQCAASGNEDHCLSVGLYSAAALRIHKHFT